jgi:hypothetical protein
VPRKEEKRHVAGSEALDQFVQLSQQRPAAEVLALDHVEADALEGAADGAGVVHRLLELLVGGKVGVTLVADHEGDTFLRVRCRGRADERQPGDCNELTKSHFRLPPKQGDNALDLMQPV